MPDVEDVIELDVDVEENLENDITLTDDDFTRSKADPNPTLNDEDDSEIEQTPPGLDDGEILGEEPEPPFVEVKLTKEMIRCGLSHVARTLDTFEFAYSRFDGRARNLTDCDALAEYIHLRVINLSGNKLRTVRCLSNIKHLLVLILNDNQLSTLKDIPHFPFLQALSAKGNRLYSAEGLFPNSLTYLQLSFNMISNMYTFDHHNFPYLTMLELRGNNITSLVGINLPTLERLFVAQNKLMSLQGLDTCFNLTHLHARDNNISRMDQFPPLEKLEYINLRQNNIKRYTQMVNLGNAQNLRTLIFKGNPIATLDDYKLEVIAANINLKRLDKVPVTEIDLVQGRELRTAREKGIIPPVSDDLTICSPPPEEEEEMEGEDLEEEGEGREPPILYPEYPDPEGDLQTAKISTTNIEVQPNWQQLEIARNSKKPETKK